MIEHGIDPLAQAPESYTSDEPLEKRLGDLLAYAAATGRLTDDEVELVEASITSEARIRHQAHLAMEEYQRWLETAPARHWIEGRDGNSTRGRVTYPDDAEPEEVEYETTQREAEAC